MKIKHVGEECPRCCDETLIEFDGYAICENQFSYDSPYPCGFSTEGLDE